MVNWMSGRKSFMFCPNFLTLAIDKMEKGLVD